MKATHRIQWNSFCTRKSIQRERGTYNHDVQQLCACEWEYNSHRISFYFRSKAKFIHTFTRKTAQTHTHTIIDMCMFIYTIYGYLAFALQFDIHERADTDFMNELLSRFFKIHTYKILIDLYCGMVSLFVHCWRYYMSLRHISLKGFHSHILVSCLCVLFLSFFISFLFHLLTR